MFRKRTGSNRKKLHEKGIVDKMKNTRTRSSESKQQTEVALANLSFPYEDKYDDNGVAVSTSPSSEGIVLPPLSTPFLLPHELVDDEDDEDFTESSFLASSKPSPPPAITSSAPKTVPKELPASPKSKAPPAQTGSIYKATPPQTTKDSPSRASTIVAPSKPLPISPQQPVS